MCWTNGTTLAVKYKIKLCSCWKSDIVTFNIVLCIYLTLFCVSGGLSCVQDFKMFFLFLRYWTLHGEKLYWHKQDFFASALVFDIYVQKKRLILQYAIFAGMLITLHPLQTTAWVKFFSRGLKGRLIQSRAVMYLTETRLNCTLLL